MYINNYIFSKDNPHTGSKTAHQYALIYSRSQSKDTLHLLLETSRRDSPKIYHGENHTNA